MKSSSAILGLPIFSLTEGKEIGRVRQLVISPEQGRISLIVLDYDRDSLGVYVLPFAAAVGIGDFAVTVESRDSIFEMAHVSGARELILQDYKLIGMRVLSSKGQLLGQVNEYYADVESGEVSVSSYEPSDAPGDIRYVYRPNIMTFGSDVVVIRSEDQIYNDLDPSRLTVAPEPAAALHAVRSEEAAAAQETIAEEEAVDAPSSQYGYLVGKVLKADLSDDAGELLVAEGTQLTDELIERVKAAGPTYFMKLNRLAVDPR